MNDRIFSRFVSLRLMWHLLAQRALVAVLLLGTAMLAQSRNERSPVPTAGVPPQVRQSQHFLAQRGGSRRGGITPLARLRVNARAVSPESASVAPAWEPIGPAAVLTPEYGLVTGRISSLALDPADPTGNTLYVGTTGGGLWRAQNAATGTASKVLFTPLTERPGALSSVRDASISIGAVTVQPGGTGVILAGTGDPNDALDSYYGAGLLRSSDGGATWSLVAGTNDVSTGLGAIDRSFLGEGFAGFAWSTVNPQLVVAAVSQAYEGALVDAGTLTSSSGLYYSTDSGATWHFSRVTDGNGFDVQDPNLQSSGANAATAVVWNPVRKVFIAAMRFHGYYQSADGVTWTRLANQPGAGLTTLMCPTNSTSTGSPACPIFRGALAVNPLTGDTFAWTIDLNNQDQGLWQDSCNVNGGVCAGQSIAFSKRWSTSGLETGTTQGAATILNGDYNLALAAVPSSQDTLLFAGANDLWKCSLAMGCTWRNTTNTTTCMSAAVGEYQHAFEWNRANPLEIFVGNDSGVWRSEDAVAETGAVCSASDAEHWQNLNGGLGSLAEVASMSQVNASSYTLVVGLGANGTAGVKSTTGPTATWPQILGGEGGPVAVDPVQTDNWYVNNGAGVFIRRCSTSDLCTQSDFGQSPIIASADVANDGLTLTGPAPFVVDPLDPAQLIVATCRLWRGPAAPNTWTSANAVTPMLGSGTSASRCSGNPLIRTIAAFPLAGGGEVVLAGLYGNMNGGGNLPGHLLKTTMNANGVWSGWTDLTFSPVLNDTLRFNYYGLDVTSITFDPHDQTGNTIYETIAGIPGRDSIRMVYRSSDGGAHWKDITSLLPSAPANDLVVDPADANTVYVATDTGVFITHQVTNCGNSGVMCWNAYGSGLPESPVIALSASPAGATPQVLVAGTYGRGVWQVPLPNAGLQMTSASASPLALTFDSQAQGGVSDPQPIALTNTGGIALVPTAITVTGDFAETDNCLNQNINAGTSCSIQVKFAPTRLGTRTGQLTIQANISTGSIVVNLSGTGVTPGTVNLQPALIDFGKVEAGTASALQQITAENGGGAPVSITSISVSGPFAVASNACGTASLAPTSDCQLQVTFNPTTAGPASGLLIMVDSAGTQTVQLAGTGTAPPTDSLSPQSLTFPATVIGVNSAAQAVTLTNGGENPLTSISVSVSGPFQQSNNCNAQLTGGAGCSVTVTYLPTAAGAQSGTLTVSDILKTQTVQLSGIGLTPPAFSANPTRLDFGGQQVKLTTAPMALNITNSGGAPLADVGFQITGTSASDFAAGATTCGASLAAAASCTLQVTFTPSATGAEQASLVISSSTSQVKPFTVPLSGTGQTAAGVSATPAQLTFSAAATGQTSAAQTVTISNTGQTTADALTLSVSGPFAIAQTTCGTVLASGANCTAGIVFKPLQTGELSGALTVSSKSVPAPATVALNGLGGLTGALQIQPAQLAFPVTGVGNTSNPVTVTLTNTDLSIALEKFVLHTASPFAIAGTTCGSSLPAGASCTASVSFTPAAAGTLTGTLTVSSTAFDVDATVPLTGQGFDFAPAGSGTSSQTVASGQTASYSISVVPGSGAAGTFTFDCKSLPSYAACVFNPSTLQVAAGASGTETVSITTSQSISAAPVPAWRGGAFCAALAGGLLFLPVFTRKRRRLFGLCLLLALGLVVPGCAGSGGGGGGTPPAPSPTTHTTPAGTYTITLDVSSNGVQHALTLTLVVD